MSPAEARGLTPGVAFRYCGLRYRLASVYTTPQGAVFLVPEPPLAAMFPAAQCDRDRPVRTPATRKKGIAPR